MFTSLLQHTKLTIYEIASTKDKNYSGPKGGVLLLIEESLLKTRKTTDEVCAELNKKGYVYSRNVIQTALNRLSTSKGPLVKIEASGKKVYVERK